MTELESETLKIEAQKLQLEEAKLELERETLKLEHFKAWWTGGSITVPLVVVVATICFGIWSQNRQAQNQFEISKLQAERQFELQGQQERSQAELQAQQARNQFELKAAEIVMNTGSPVTALTKAKALANMFPERLPNNFASSFDPKVYAMPLTTKRGSQRREVPFGIRREWRALPSPDKMPEPRVKGS